MNKLLIDFWRKERFLVVFKTKILLRNIAGFWLCLYWYFLNTSLVVDFYSEATEKIIYVPSTRHWGGGAFSFTHVHMSIHPTFGVLLNNLRSPLENHLKFTHKVRGHKRKAEYDFGLYHFFHSWTMPLFMFSWKRFSILELCPCLCLAGSDFPFLNYAPCLYLAGNDFPFLSYALVYA